MGGTWGYTTYNSFYGDTDQTSIIILSNVSRLPITEIGLDVEKMVFDKTFKTPSLNKISDQQLELDTYTGRFVMEDTNRVLQIIKKENRLYAQLEGNPPFEIYPKTEHVFFGKKVALDIYFEVSVNKLVSGLRVERKGQSIRFKKLTL